MAGGEPLRTSGGQCVHTGYWSAPAPQPKQVTYSTQVLFAFDEDVLDAQARKQLDALARKLGAVEIERVMAGKGVAAERLELVAMGAHDPVTAGARGPSRRVEVELTGIEKAGD